MNVKFKEILNHPLVQEYKPKIIVGGPGAWQFEDDKVKKREKYDLDIVVLGEGRRLFMI